MFGWKEKREIFQYYDGLINRKADPLLLLERVTQSDFDMQSDMDLVLADDPAAFNKMIEMVYSVFEVKEYEKGGLTRLECHDLFDRFLGYLVDLKKKRDAMRTQSEPMEQPSSETESETTKHESEFTSTPKEQKSVEPILSSEP
jgi:hypothetical protein